MEDLLPPLSWTNLLILPGLLVGFTVHELGRAVAAYYLGDHTQVEHGRITLNPLLHVSWLGGLFFLVLGLGWPKAIRVNPENFKRKHLDLAIVALAGPFASLTFSLAWFLVTLSIAAGLVYTTGAPTERAFECMFLNPLNPPETFNVQAWSIAMTGSVAIASLRLAVISLIPLPGLDGFIALMGIIAHVRNRKQETQKVMVADQTGTLIKQYKRRHNAADIHFQHGVAYHEAQQYEDAIARYRQALRSDTHFGPAYVNLGLVYLALGRKREAIQSFRGAIQLADDQKSQTAAWRQLHALSEVSPVDLEAAQLSMHELGSTPWTDTKPQPDWFGLGFTGLLILIGVVTMYGYLVPQLVRLLNE